MRLTRDGALVVLRTAGFPTGTVTTNLGLDVPAELVMVAVADAESDLYVSAQGPPNSDGSVDRGWLQINSAHGDDPDLLLSDPDYTARCGLEVLFAQGIRAWAAYSVKNRDGVYPYSKRMPPGMGGPTLAAGMNLPVIGSVQAFLTRAGYPVVADNAWGPATTAAVKAWKGKNHNDGNTMIDGRTWAAMTARGLW